MWDRLWIDVHLAAHANGTGEIGGDDFGIVKNGAIASRDGRIAWVGNAADLPGPVDGLARDIVRCNGAWMTPGLIDAHTHLVYAGDRSDEFAERLQGIRYEDIARRGGGILSSVQATRAASKEALLEATLQRARIMIDHGVTTVEIKSGYGLRLEDELKQMRVARAVARYLPLRVHKTFLGAHALPPEYMNDRARYIDHLCAIMIPAVASEGLADSVDAFCEKIAFTPDEVGRVFECAAAHGLPVRLHADQISDLGGAALAAKFGALSADHLEYASVSGLQAMARSGTVAMILPGAYYFTRESTRPPIAAMRQTGMAMGLASDCNPGTSPMLSPTCVMNMGCTLFGMTPGEALAGMTHVAARALGLSKEIGRLSVGMVADMALWDVNGPHELSYWIGGIRPIARIFSGNMPSIE